MSTKRTVCQGQQGQPAGEAGWGCRRLTLGTRRCRRVHQPSLCSAPLCTRCREHTSTWPAQGHLPQPAPVGLLLMPAPVLLPVWHVAEIRAQKASDGMGRQGKVVGEGNKLVLQEPWVKRGVAQGQRKKSEQANDKTSQLMRARRAGQLRL